MAKLLAKFFIKNYKNVNDPNVCDNYGIVGSFFGIVTNAILNWLLDSSFHLCR